MFCKEYAHNGIAVVQLSASMKLFNPALYRVAQIGGGACATTAMQKIELDGVTNQDGIIVLLDELVERLSPEEKLAILEHEAAHILNGDVTLTDEQKKAAMKRQKTKLNNILEQEIRADAAGAAATSPEIMMSARAVLKEFQLDSFGIKPQWLRKFIRFTQKFGIEKKRDDALKAMMK